MINDIKKFILRGAVFILLCLMIDFAIGKVVQVLFYSQENKLSKGILKTESDILIVGSSRANHHYIPEIFSDTLKMSCFNMGSGGQGTYYNYAIIGSVFERYSPKIIIMDVMDADINKRDIDKDRLSELLPYYSISENIRAVIDIKGSKERIRLFSRVYPYNSKLSSIVFSFVMKGSNPFIINDGYIPLEGNIGYNPIVVENREQNIIDSVKINMLLKIVELCKQHNTTLIIVMSPKYLKYTNESTFIETLSILLEKQDIRIWDYEQDPRFITKGELFKDELHLNNQGAIEYSRIIAGRIKDDYIRK